MRELDKKKSESEASKKVEDPKPSQPDDVGKIVHGVIDQLNKENSIKMKVCKERVEEKRKRKSKEIAANRLCSIVSP